jgi:hypothetical protein
MFSFIVVTSQRYASMGKNKKRKLENYTHEQAQTFAYNRVICKVT